MISVNNKKELLKFSEEELLEGLTPYFAHADELLEDGGSFNPFVVAALSIQDEHNPKNNLRFKGNTREERKQELHDFFFSNKPNITSEQIMKKVIDMFGMDFVEYFLNNTPEEVAEEPTD